MRKIAIVIAVVALVAAYIGYPYFCLWRLGEAVKASDVAGVQAYVDFDSVRTSLKADIKNNAFGDTDATNPAAALGMLLGAPLVDALIDGTVNAESSVRQYHLAKGLGIDVPVRVNYAFFSSPSEFRVDGEADLGSRKPRGTVLMKFSNFRWRVYRVLLPLDELSDLRRQLPGGRP